MQVESRSVFAWTFVAALALAPAAAHTQEAAVAPAPAPRRIVLCLDGTWNNAYSERERDDGSKVAKPSNVLKTCRAVLAQDAAGRDQLVYYQTGVGSLTVYPGISNKLLQRSDRLFGGAWGAGFESHIAEAVTFLSHNYRPGDQVFVFGFSRGAATARGLTRFIDWAGGLPTKGDAYWLPFMYREYIVSRGAADVEEWKAGLRRPLEPFHDVEIDYLGVWDTVMALGSRFRAEKGGATSVKGKTFHVGPEPAACVRHARQALAIDERRYDFRPEVWLEAGDGQTLEQRWFPGVHTNVGGGYVRDGLANGPFRWLLDGAEDLGLAVDRKFVGFYRPFPQDRMADSRSALYRFLEAVRLRRGKGKRPLVGQPAAAHLQLDRSVIHRLIADPAEFAELGEPYRPDNVLRLLACQDDLDAYLAAIPGLKPEHRQLPADAMARITELRARPGGAGCS